MDFEIIISGRGTQFLCVLPSYVFGGMAVFGGQGKAPEPCRICRDECQIGECPFEDRGDILIYP